MVKVIAYVLMPDHFHLIVNPRDGDIRGFKGALKSLTAREVIGIDTENKRAGASRPSRPDRLGRLNDTAVDIFNVGESGGQAALPDLIG
jgi:REP element-mobilizing transposase RayT